MPYPNEHAARLRDPGDFNPDTFRRTKGGTIYGSKAVPSTIGIIWGKLKGADAPGDNPIPQALRFPTANWTADEAKGWLSDNEIKYISFEAASEADAMPRQDIEKRFLPTAELSVETREDGPPRIIGYAAVFDSLSLDLGGFREQIALGAFGKALKAGADVRALVDHDPAKILGRTKAGTLVLREDGYGLLADFSVPDTTAGRDVVKSIRRGDLDGMSFAFTTVADRWETVDGEELRTLVEVIPHDVSVVTYPAYPDTTVAVRNLRTIQAVREAGLHPSVARAKIRLAEAQEKIFRHS